MTLPPRHPSLRRSSSRAQRRQPTSATTTDEQLRRRRAIRARDDALAEIARLERKLLQVQEECRNVEQRIESQKYHFEREMKYIAFDYLQDHPSENYVQVIGPVDNTIVENPTQIGEYRLDQVVGKGMSGSVHKATNIVSNKRYALKIINKDDLTNLNILQSLVREVRALEVCQDHPNVVGYHGVIHAPNNIYLVQDLAHTDLYNYLAGRQGLSITHARTIFQAVFRALDFAHSHGIAHMDVKRENILITQDVALDELKPHHVQLCDFGISKHSSTGRHGPIPITGLCGSPAFFAPELATASGDEVSCEGRAADMWSVGATLLEIVEGLPKGWSRTYRLAHDAPYIFQRGILQQVQDLWDETDVTDLEVHNLICQLLAMDPNERISAKESLKHRWFLEWFANAENQS